MQGKKFWSSNIIGSFLWGVAMIILGVFFAEYYKIILDYVAYIFVGLMVGTIGYIYFFRRKDFDVYIHDKMKEFESLPK